MLCKTKMSSEEEVGRVEEKEMLGRTSKKDSLVDTGDITSVGKRRWATGHKA